MKPGIDKQELSTNVSAKHDLFRHVNGSWLDETEIPEDKAVFGSFYMLADDAELAVKEILEEAAANPRPGVSQQIGDLYSSFLDEDRVEAAGLGRVQGPRKDCRYLLHEGVLHNDWRARARRRWGPLGKLRRQ
jgi:putative endopeptidase